MRILIFPTYTNQNINGCTTFIFVKNLIRVLSQKNCFVYLTVPLDVEYDKSSLAYDNVKVLSIDYEFRTHSETQLKSLTYTPKALFEVFNDKNGIYYVDVVVTSSSLMITQLKAHLTDYVESFTDRPIYVSLIMFALGLKTGVPDSFRDLQSIGLVSSDLIAWQSKTSMKRALGSCRKTLSSSEIMRLQKKSSKSRVVSAPVKIIEKANVKEKPKDKWIVNYGYSLSGAYDYPTVFKIFDYIFCAGHPIEVRMNTSSLRRGALMGESKEAWNKRYKHYFKMTHALPQLEFWEQASDCHAFLFLAKDAESSFSVIEQHLLGMVGVYLDSEYANEVTYKGYPYIYKGINNLCAGLKHVLVNYHSEEVQEVIQLQREHLLEKFDIDENCICLYEEVRNLVEERDSLSKPSKGTIEITKMATNEASTITYEELVASVKEVSTKGLDISNGERMATRKSKFFGAMRLLGYEQEYSSEQPIWRKS